MESNYLDFIRCQRADGSHYGTAGQCRKGREVDARDIVKELSTRKFTVTKKGVIEGAIDPRKGLVGNGKDLGNGILITKGDSRDLEKLGKLPGIPRVIGDQKNNPNTVIVARKTIRPWADLEVPVNARVPFRKDSPQKFWLTKHSQDVDMAVNPTLVTANSLLKSSYNRYNKEFFDGKLPDIDLYIAPSLTGSYGLAYPTLNSKSGAPAIALSWKFTKNATEEAIHGVLLHEMVHVHDYVNNRYGENHGPIFRSKLDGINKAWKRESQKRYVDTIIDASGGSHRTDGERYKAATTRLHPQIKLDQSLLDKTKDDTNVRIIKWK